MLLLSSTTDEFTLKLNTFTFNGYVIDSRLPMVCLKVLFNATIVILCTHLALPMNMDKALSLHLHEFFYLKCLNTAGKRAQWVKVLAI